jgi:hypothetical protein
MEEHTNQKSYSYRLILQEAMDNGIWFMAEKEGTDWIGTDLLESLLVSYQLIKEEGDWKWDRLGDWYRSIGPDTGNPMETQWQEHRLWHEGKRSPIQATVASISVPVPVSVPVSVPLFDVYNMRYSNNTEQEQYSGRGRGRGSGRGGGGGRGRGRGRGRGNSSI